MPESSLIYPDPPPLFPLGLLVMTPGAAALLQRHVLSPWSLIQRHVEGDWGDVDAEDAAANLDAVQSGARIFSVYRVQAQRLWVITEAATDEAGLNRASTCLLLPEEY